ncbi:MAG: ATP-binding cassette domain-containing protein [Saprospiraceae bacterium]
MSVLKIDNVVKRFQTKTAVDGVSLELEKGQIFGLLGPNGAGKTTLIRMITKIFNPDSGKITLSGDNEKELSTSMIGYMPEERGLYKKMKVGEQLMYLAQLKGLSANEAKDSLLYWLGRFEIKDWWNKKVDELSKGMQQKVQFVSTVSHNPQFLVFDEPFSGLDPVNSQMIKNEILNLKNSGVTIIFSTHRMEQVEEMCDDIALINQGKIILEGKVDEIKNKYREHKFILESNDKFDGEWNNEFSIIEKSDNKITVQLTENQTSRQLLKYIVDSGIDIKLFKESLPSLNDIFIKLVTEK